MVIYLEEVLELCPLPRQKEELERVLRTVAAKKEKARGEDAYDWIKEA